MSHSPVHGDDGWHPGANPGDVVKHHTRRAIGMLALVVALLLLWALSMAKAAPAATSIKAYFNVGANGLCPAYGDLRICSGRVPSYDGSRLDVDLTLPMSGTGGRHPLIVALHHTGATKHEFESTTDSATNTDPTAFTGQDKYHWNSHWFARHGYYVLTYTQRGFSDPGIDAAYEPNTPSFSSIDPPNGTWGGGMKTYNEPPTAHDTQWLAALVAAAFPGVDPRRVAVTGNSAGGNLSWQLASESTWSAPHEQDPSLPVLHLQVALPRFGWTDTLYSYFPSGHGGGPTGQDLYESSLGRPDSSAGNPFGTAKLSFLTALATPNPKASTAQLAPSFLAELGRALAGDPYDTAGVDDPIMHTLRELNVGADPYYDDARWRGQARGRKVAIFAVQGWRDEVTPSLEAFREFKYLKRLDRRWPVTVALADIGHVSHDQNSLSAWRDLNQRLWRWLGANIDGSHDEDTKIVSEATVCHGKPNPADQISAATPEQLARGTLAIDYPRGATLTSTGGLNDPNGPATDPEAPANQTAKCVSSPGPAVGGLTALSKPLPSAATYIGIGHVTLPYTLIGTTALLFARVWDVAPTGQALLIDRGAYRIDPPYDQPARTPPHFVHPPGFDPPAGTIRLPLFGNDYRFAAGHRIRLDLTQVDRPTFQPSNVISSIQVEAPRLVLPIRQRRGAK